MKEFKPIEERSHPAGEGIQKIYRFPNDYGASVVRFKMMLVGGYGSYTDNEEEWELAVIKFDGEDNDKFDLEYDTEITDDVMGHLSNDDVNKILERIEKLDFEPD